MTVKPIGVKLNNNNNSGHEQPKMLTAKVSAPANFSLQNSEAPQIPQTTSQGDKVTFKGVGGDFVIMFMDGIERGGFVASFLAQDCVGMVTPRIAEGLNRNREETGKLNWDFARREMLRECLSGPSVFIIPASMLALIKKFSGTANNVHVDYIKGFGKEFEKYAKENPTGFKDATSTQKALAANVYENVLRTTTANQMPEQEIKATAQHFAEELVRSNKAKSKGFFRKLAGKSVPNSKEDILANISNEFVAIRKRYNAPSTNQLNVEFIGANNKKLVANFKKFSNSLLDYSNDAVHNAKKFFDKNNAGNVAEFIQKHTSRRVGSRALTNLGAWLAVVTFYFFIPKIYSMGLNGTNPGLAGLDAEETTVETKKKDKKANKAKDEVAFEGKTNIFNGVAKGLEKKNFKKVSDFFELDGNSMTTNSTLALLFGFCLPTRLMNSTDKHDTKEILTRDLFSFISILFGANVISRAFSKLFAGASGLALNTTPANHEKSIFHKIKNYAWPSGGIDVLSSDEIVAKYSKIQDYKDGINGFFEFVQENGGNLKRMLSVDKTIKANAEKILGKPLANAENLEIEEAFRNAQKNGSKHLDAIYDALKAPDNKLVKKAKILNSSFKFASIVVLVPAFMIWLARHCERMTKRDVTKEQFKEIAKDYMHEDFSSADPEVIRALDDKVLNDIKAGKIYGYKYDAQNNMIRNLAHKEKQVSDVRVEIKKYVDMAVPKGQERVIHRHKAQILEEKQPVTEKNNDNNDYRLYLNNQEQFKANFLTK